MRTKLSVCRRKVRHASAEDAMSAVRRAGMPFRPYRCDRCGHFHLTSRTKGKWMPLEPADMLEAPENEA